MDSKLEYKVVEDLTPSEQLELMNFKLSSYFRLLCKIMEFEVIASRDEAMAIDPAKRDEQVARVTIAHAEAKFYQRVRAVIENAANEHLGIVRAKAAEEALKDQDNFEEIILSQSR